MKFNCPTVTHCYVNGPGNSLKQITGGQTLRANNSKVFTSFEWFGTTCSDHSIPLQRGTRLPASSSPHSSGGPGALANIKSSLVTTHKHACPLPSGSYHVVIFWFYAFLSELYSRDSYVHNCCLANEILLRSGTSEPPSMVTLVSKSSSLTRT